MRQSALWYIVFGILSWGQIALGRHVPLLYLKLLTLEEYILVDIVSHHRSNCKNIEDDEYIAIHFLMWKVAEQSGLKIIHDYKIIPLINFAVVNFRNYFSFWV